MTPIFICFQASEGQIYVRPDKVMALVPLGDHQTFIYLSAGQPILVRSSVEDAAKAIAATLRHED